MLRGYTRLLGSGKMELLLNCHRGTFIEIISVSRDGSSIDMANTESGDPPFNAGQALNGQTIAGRRESFSSQNSQTAKEFIESQIRLEADAREVLPYSFDTCTQDLGPLRQSLFACLTCNPSTSEESYTPAAVCYSCSISCHGEHDLVELFNKRNFVCDCGTTRMPATSPCTLRNDPKTGAKGVHSEQPHQGNNYNHNFQNKFCGCGEDYDPHKERGTMFQCLGLGTVETGGCGEDWWHPECLIGLPRDWYKGAKKDGATDGETADDDEEEETPLPPGFPAEEDFAIFLCYKCVDSNPWVKRYAGTPGFLPPVYKEGGLAKPSEEETKPTTIEQTPQTTEPEQPSNPKKRKADDSADEESDPAPKRPKEEPTEEPKPGNNDTTTTTTTESKPNTAQDTDKTTTTTNPSPPKHTHLPPTPPSHTFSLFLKDDFRDHFCRCRDCYPHLASHSQLREEEETYEPPMSEDGDGEGPNGGGSTGTGSLLDRGEAALSNIDRVRAIEGAMVYNHLRDKVKEFLKPFAETGKAVSAEDIKSYFEKLRGDEQSIRDAASSAAGGGGGGNDDGDGGEGGGRREQSGY
ncbi:hypothetical protein BO79DRAFT_241696 [Aspergillus costaricaensis CBS 115574]|uniref:Uncharacterized protein n=1 Tax=Aspergillus costaricaensis CBS 115574 TaxID=1448317 RepID=A0ACD1IU44_9EURO|nr:hypothetical protein BO79DRAFT_241696 [Aspergillus costaricaensis CBS 115574]RAK94142.1 hypothetical protein BO79DRAFT_241696 [Aspergillus costaricaensis CBS 115574]